MAAGFLCALVLCSCSTPTATQGQTESMPSLAADTSSAYGSASATSVIPSDTASTEATGSTQRQESTAAIRPGNSVIRPEQTAPPMQDTTESRKPPAASTESNRDTSSTHSEQRQEQPTPLPHSLHHLPLKNHRGYIPTMFRRLSGNAKRKSPVWLRLLTLGGCGMTA